MATTNNPLGLEIDTTYGLSDVEEHVFGLLAAYLPPVSTITPQQVADKIHSFFPHGCLGENDDYYPRQFLGDFWRSRFEALRTHPLAIETRQACKAAMDGMDVFKTS